MLKVRKNRAPAMPEKCQVSECMSLLGGAWTPNIIWNLHGGPRRFGELRVDIPRVSPKMLSARLKELEANGVVERRVMPTSPPSVEYSLSDLGQQLLPAIHAIAEVGGQLKQRAAEKAHLKASKAREKAASAGPEADG